MYPLEVAYAKVAVTLEGPPDTLYFNVNSISVLRTDSEQCEIY